MLASRRGAAVAPSTFDVPPRWQIVPPDGVVRAGWLPLRLFPGPGFGDGRHPTTQLCLGALAALAPRGRAWRLLDLGSGSGILSIAGARLGASVDAVEIDPQAVEHAEQNLVLNGVVANVRQVTAIDDTVGPFDVVVANIIRSVLLSLAVPLVERLAPGGTLVLSGLVSTDVPEVSSAYQRLLGARPEVYERDEWRGIVWRSAQRRP
jgi:ribosomal protein L11 methyltransferase